MKTEKRFTLADDAALAAAQGKLSALKAKASELEKQLVDAHARREGDALAAADEILAGKPLPRRNGPSANDLSEQLAIVGQAIELQTRKVDQARDEAMRRLHREWAAYRKPLLNSLAQAVGMMIASLDSMGTFDADLEAAGGRPEMLTCALPSAGGSAEHLREVLHAWQEQHAAGAFDK